MAKNKLSALKNKYKGNRAFLVGNGPSLNNTPLDMIKDDYSFAMNRISLIYEKVKWRPSFFICTTNNIYRKSWQKDIFKSIDLGITSFVWDKFKDLVGERENVYYLNCTDGEHITGKPNDEWWSDDISKRVSKFGTSMLVALQIASYMGFNPLYLIGCDLGYVKPKRNLLQKITAKFAKKYEPFSNDPNHFDPNYGTPGASADNLALNMNAAHRLALSNTKRLGIKIANATVGGSLEVYPRVDIHSIIAKKDK
jgi:hypothetical protein